MADLIAAEPSSGSSSRRRPRSLRHLPLPVRLVAGFAVAMLLVLCGAGAFVFFRVQYALDVRLDEDLTAQSEQLRKLATDGASPGDVGAAVAPGNYYQLLDSANTVLSGTERRGTSLLNSQEFGSALRASLRTDHGGLFETSPQPLRINAEPLAIDPGQGGVQPAVAVVAVSLDQRNEALRELIGQLGLANLAALAIASFVGYRVARGALTPVERYRTEAARIASGAVGVRLPVPVDSRDEVDRLGHTLNDMLAELETAMARERRFLNDASHELRTPLTLMSTEIELALRRPRTVEELEQTLRDVATDTARLVALADGLLAGDVSAPTENAEVDLGAVAYRIAKRYSITNPTWEIRLVVEKHLTTIGDQTQIARILTNLLDNAMRYGAPPIIITGDRAGPSVRLSVHDNGPGIDSNFLAHATQRLSRADTSRTSPGTGIGLALVEAIVLAHSGELRICSAGNHHRINKVFDAPCAHSDNGTAVSVMLSGPSG